MKRVYILWVGCTDDYSVHGIYSTEKKAEKEKERLENDHHYHGEIWIDIHDLK